jgi:DNA-binding winged helix-turn-helix (wHTH) protein
MGEGISHKSGYRFGSFFFWPSRRILINEGKKERISLPEKTLAVLEVLVDNAERLVTKDVLLDKVWPDTAVELNNVDQHISNLRKELGETPGQNQYILTVPREGYKFVSPVEVVAPAEIAAIVEAVPPVKVVGPFEQGQGNAIMKGEKSVCASDGAKSDVDNYPDWRSVAEAQNDLLEDMRLSALVDKMDQELARAEDLYHRLHDGGLDPLDDALAYYDHEDEDGNLP